MPSHPPLRFLIVGSGLAGSLLAWELQNLGGEVTICSDPAHAGSSPVAAGLITPITGLRFVKSWNLERVFPGAQATYRQIEKLTGTTILEPFHILRLFKNAEESRRWERKSTQPEMQEFVVHQWDKVPPVPGIIHEGGGLEIRGGGWVNMPVLLRSLQGLMQPRIRFLFQSLDYAELQFTASKALWQKEEFDHVIFCQGYRPDNPWFDWLPWKPAQGEILTLRIPGFSTDRIINRGLFILPLGGDLFRCGSTYNWTYLQSQPSPEGRAQLESSIRDLISLPFEVVEHSAAIRPILRDTFPAMGLHPQHRSLGIFNGLGSKGALTAPYYARHFARYLLVGEPLDSEIDIARNS